MEYGKKIAVCSFTKLLPTFSFKLHRQSSLPHFTAPLPTPSIPKMTTSIHMTTLDGIIHVNSLFTLAVFVGLTWNPADKTKNLIIDSSCTASSSVGEAVVSFHVFAFSSFLFSSLIALALKQAIRIARSYHYHPTAEFLAEINLTALRIGMLASGVGSVCGFGCLMLALINVVQIKLGIFGCGSSDTYVAVVPLIILIPLGLLLYVLMVLYSFTH